jgi:hypothetical protein
MPEYTVEEEIELLADAGLLTERQAEAYVQRRVEAQPGYAVADQMDIIDSTLSDYVSAAEEKVEAARDTVDALEEIRWQAGEPPDDSTGWSGVRMPRVAFEATMDRARTSEPHEIVIREAQSRGEEENTAIEMLFVDEGALLYFAEPGSELQHRFINDHELAAEAFRELVIDTLDEYERRTNDSFVAEYDVGRSSGVFNFDDARVEQSDR